MSDHTRTASEKADFKRALTDVVPHLRAFARGLCGRPDMAEAGGKNPEALDQALRESYGTVEAMLG